MQVIFFYTNIFLIIGDLSGYLHSGRGGEVIRDICHTSGAKVKMEEKGLEPDNAANRKVTVKGTPEQIKMALEIIDQIVRTYLLLFLFLCI